MQVLKYAAGVGLAVVLLVFTPIASAQTGAGVGAGAELSGHEAGAGINAGTAGAAAPEGMSAQQLATQLSGDISKAKASGKNVSTAEKEQREGQQALTKGDTAVARAHFLNAEQSLGMSGDTSSGMGAGGAVNVR